MGYLLERDVIVVIQDYEELQQAVSFPVISGFTVDRPVNFKSTRADAESLEVTARRVGSV